MNPTMLTYQCPHCGMAVDVEPGTAEELLKCPSSSCGKPFQAELPTAVPATPRAAAILAATPAERPLAAPLADHEDEIQRVSLSMVRRHPVRCALYGLVAAGGLAAMSYAFVQGWTYPAMGAGLIAAFGIIRLVLWWLRVRSTEITITSKRCLLKTGVFSPKTDEVMFENVTDIRVSQNLITRLLDVGDILIASENGEKRQVVLMGVPAPLRIVEQMRSKA